MPHTLFDKSANIDRALRVLSASASLLACRLVRLEGEAGVLGRVLVDFAERAGNSRHFMHITSLPAAIHRLRVSVAQRHGVNDVVFHVAFLGYLLSEMTLLISKLHANVTRWDSQKWLRRSSYFLNVVIVLGIVRNTGTFLRTLKAYVSTAIANLTPPPPSSTPPLETGSSNEGGGRVRSRTGSLDEPLVDKQIARRAMMKDCMVSYFIQFTDLSLMLTRSGVWPNLVVGETALILGALSPLVALRREYVAMQ